jgi:CO/xanthine dehydrogenase Mo-binding subunit
MEIHLKNASQPGDTTPEGYKITTCGMEECLRKAAEASEWQKRRKELAPFRGIGMGTSGFITGVKLSGHNSASAVIKMKEDGTVSVLTGATDIGQGSSTVLSQVAAEVLGVRLEDITINEGVDTDTTPIDPGTYGSRVSFYSGNAVKKAAENVKDQLKEIAAQVLEADLADLELKERTVIVRGYPEKGVSIGRLVRYAQNKLGKMIIGHASYDSGIDFVDYQTGKGNLSATYTFACDVVEVEVDPETGQITLTNCVGAHDVGKALNPVLCEGQLNGAFVMSQGQLLYEDLIRQDGKVLNPSFRDYKMPTAVNIPKNHKNIMVETNDPEGPFGAKEVGEGASVAIFPALANAIYDAIGVRIKELPISAEKVLEAIKERRGNNKS